MGDVSQKHAAVLVPLFEDPRTRAPHVILTERTSTLRAHGGEVSLPGGKRDEEDADDVATALRESHEELGLDPRSVQVLGTLRPFLSKYLLSVTPVLAAIPARHAFRPNPEEVDSVFACPLDFFLRAAQHRSHDTELVPGTPYRVHFFDYTDHDGRTYCVWGLTAAMLIEVARLAYGREPEFEPLPFGYRALTADMFTGSQMR
ncbi:hypothetical protein QBZ16_000544 [Prototheca wickerhamii]|uniref:Nudix hydrolase domain-containing protein n=1 Tax=Prototheca wickerhamii TaxID=3111 RepID=A0AAD9IP60_PROWI|nr:hypothetical protein QBZ16_000544 [Prototheca wickerhamii]